MSCVSGGLLEALSGVQEPSFRRVPAAAVGSEGDDAVFLASQYELQPDPWQEMVLRDWLGRRPDGKWAATRCGLAVPRQNGKNGILEMRELYGLVLLGETFLHTAHEVKTARKAFKRLLSFFDDEQMPPRFPELSALVAEIRRANGQEAIYFTNGGSVEFIARSKGSGRGFTVDVIVMDEAQELSEDALAALVPTRSAAPLRNPQLIFTGTPPAPTMNGEVFTRTRVAGLKGNDPRLAWHEWSIPAPGLDQPPIDLDDAGLLAQANPALGGRVLQETIEDDRSGLSYEGFARERLGVWFDMTAQLAGIPADSWAERAGAEGRPAGPFAFALSASWPHAEWGSIAVVGRNGDEVWTQIVNHDRGTSWMPARVKALRDEWNPVAIVLDDKDPAVREKTALEQAGVELMPLTSAQVTQAYGMLIASVVGDAPYLRHYDQPELNAAVASAQKRPIGDAHTWARKGPDDISPVVAVTHALYGLAVSKPKPPPNIY
jgi:hypothetical protein